MLANSLIKLVSRSSHTGLRSISNEARKWTQMMNQHLKDTDPELYDIIEKEKNRQRNSLSLIASENFTSLSVYDALGSCMSNKYSEGYPGHRYYGGNQYIDQAELLCQKRALEAFNLDPQRWGVNVQSLSGSPMNFQVYNAILSPHDRILSLDLPHGGHLSHGYQTPTKKISCVSKYFETLGYRLDEKTGYIDYNEMENLASYYRPKLVIAGASAYPRNIDYERIKKNVCLKHNCYLLADMAHIGGLVSAGVVPSPFDHCDIVTTTTHKSLRGPRGALIFYRKGTQSVGPKVEVQYDLEDKINASVFPGCQGGPHNHTISALATALKQCLTPEYKTYQLNVLNNCKSLAKSLMDKNYKLVSNGTDNHLILLDLIHSRNIDGARCEHIMELCNISTNKNTIPGDKSAMIPGGIRLGTPAMTTRGLANNDFQVVADLVDKAVTLAAELNRESSGPKLADYIKSINHNDHRILKLRDEVKHFVRQFPTIGFNEESMVYPDEVPKH